MPINGLQLGSDLQLVLVDSVQGQKTFNILTMVDLKQLTKNIKSTGIDGTTRYAELPEGWSIDLDFDKGGNTLLDFVMANEEAYFAATPIGKITASITLIEVGGVKSRYRFTGGAMKLSGGGSFKGLEKVTQKASVMFSRGRKVS
jgi:hypothetical protein